MQSCVYRALTMPEDERTLRINSLRCREKANDLNFWMRSFMEQMGSQIEEDADEVKRVTMHPVTVDDFEDYLAK
jgi:trehalose 6-phosphate synthase/phosphatase